MTNGEKFKEMFSVTQVDGCDLNVYAWLPNHDAIEIPLEWWNAEYKEPKTGHWIPVSERLPSENGDYLVTLENGVVKILGYSTTQRTTYPKGFYYIKDGFSWRQMQNPVVAWMPLPEPYKTESEG